jgi:anti-anti-sigma factor
MTQFEHDPATNTMTCTFGTRMDAGACTEIMTLITTKLGETGQTGENTRKTVLFNMNNTTYISSAFIRICLSTYHLCGKGNFAIINCDPFLKKTFKIAGLDDLLTVS